MRIYPAYNITEFQLRILQRMSALEPEFDGDEFVMPVGLFFLLDVANGADDVAAEVARRFRLLDLESKNVIDFYFFGWVAPGAVLSSGTVAAEWTFDVYAFSECLDAFTLAGITGFGGNADLVLVDACWNGGYVSLDFEHAIRVDLSRSAAEKDFPTLGSFLQSIIEAADAIAARGSSGLPGGAVARISDKLGLAIAKHSILEFFLEKWGKLIGAKRLQAVATRNLGAPVEVSELQSPGR